MSQVQYNYDIKNSIDQATCPFCAHVSKKEFIFETEHFVVIPNIYPYVEVYHVMMIPKRHIHFECDFTHEESLDFIKMNNLIAQEYKKNGYNGHVYITRQGTKSQSVWHLHRHYLPDDNWIGNVNRFEFRVSNLFNT